MPIHFASGDLLKTRAQTLVNTVNCQGVMGKGIALQFKKRFPRMFDDYVSRCKRGEVRLGEPYAYEECGTHIINFPTKGHWKASSRIGDIRAGLNYLRNHLDEWNVHSIAIPPLGCGNGGLEWDDVRPLIVRAMEDAAIDVYVYEPPGAAHQNEGAADRQPMLSLFPGDGSARDVLND